MTRNEAFEFLCKVNSLALYRLLQGKYLELSPGETMKLADAIDVFTARYKKFRDVANFLMGR